MLISLLKVSAGTHPLVTQLTQGRSGLSLDIPFRSISRSRHQEYQRLDEISGAFGQQRYFNLKEKSKDTYCKHTTLRIKSLDIAMAVDLFCCWLANH